MNLTLSFFVLLLGLINAAHATGISFTTESITATDWRYLYTVTNYGSTGDIDEFTIYFDKTLYTNLAIESSPSNWDSLAIQPDLGIPADGFMDSLALVQGVAPGGTLGGFSVSFTYLAGGNPGAQPFEMLDTNFTVIKAGMTTPVPEPQIYALFLVGLSLMRFIGVGRNRELSI